MTEAARAGTCPSTSAGYKASDSRSVYLYLASPGRSTALGNYERKEILCKKKGVMNTKKCLISKKSLDQCTKKSSPSTWQFLKDSRKTSAFCSIFACRIGRGTQGHFGVARARSHRAALQAQALSKLPCKGPSSSSELRPGSS